MCLLPLVFTDNSFAPQPAEGRDPWHNDTNGSLLARKILNTFQDSLNRCFAFFLIQLNPIAAYQYFGWISNAESKDLIK